MSSGFTGKRRHLLLLGTHSLCISSHYLARLPVKLFPAAQPCPAAPDAHPACPCSGQVTQPRTKANQGVIAGCHVPAGCSGGDTHPEAEAALGGSAVAVLGVRASGVSSAAVSGRQQRPRPANLNQQRWLCSSLSERAGLL